jgi:hypothetical protein
MRKPYQARWISKQRVDALRKSGATRHAVFLDSFNGFIVVEPVGSDLGDGEILAPETADYELQPVWCLEPKTKLVEARRLLQLNTESVPGALVAAS